MSITTDPRNVTTGRVRISCTSTEKREALVGRYVQVDHLQDGPRVGQVEKLDGQYAIVRFADGGWTRSDSIVRLVEAPASVTTRITSTDHGRIWPAQDESTGFVAAPDESCPDCPSIGSTLCTPLGESLTFPTREAAAEALEAHAERGCGDPLPQCPVCLDDGDPCDSPDHPVDVVDELCEDCSEPLELGDDGQLQPCSTCAEAVCATCTATIPGRACFGCGRIAAPVKLVGTHVRFRPDFGQVGEKRRRFVIDMEPKPAGKGDPHEGRLYVGLATTDQKRTGYRLAHLSDLIPADAVDDVEQAHAEALAEDVAHDAAMEKAQELTAAMLVQFATPRRQQPMPRQLRNRLKSARTLCVVPPVRA